MQPAVFLDRDGTIIEQVHHLTDPAQVRLLEGAGQALRQLREAGLALVLVSNQSMVGRGLLSEAGLAQVHAEMQRQLVGAGAMLDAWYYCPVAPRGSDRGLIEHPDRKPGPGMLLRAACELGLDLSRSWMVGDMLSDMLAGRHAGCRGTVLVRTGLGTSQPADHPAVGFVAGDLLAAARLILQCCDHGCPVLAVPATSTTQEGTSSCGFSARAAPGT